MLYQNDNVLNIWLMFAVALNLTSVSDVECHALVGHCNALHA